ncbi:MAG TPA: hypothetical protein VE175_04435 [Woeseiaceae bacterium]|nr:hypothetical protein [Woeseiaceae bacterium]
MLLFSQVSFGQARAFDAAEQQKIIRAAADLIEARYVDAQKAREVSTALRDSMEQWRVARNGEAFAAEVTTLLRSLSRDGHLGLSYSPDPIPEEQGEAAFSAAEMERWYGAQLNHGIEKIERLPGNIMLLDLRVFPPPAMAGDVFAAAMTVVAHGDALIIDLRRNGGGAETANVVTGYLLEGGSPLSGTYDRPTDTRTHATSPAWVPGRRLRIGSLRRPSSSGA